MAMMDGNDTRGGSDWWSENQPTATPLQGVIGGPIPTNPDGTQVGGGIPWNPNEDHPSYNPPGYIWDGRLQMFVPAPTPQADPVKPNPGGGGDGGGPAPTIGVPTSGFGAAPPVYASNPNAPAYNPMPTYVPPTWQGGDYQNPTEADLLASPGYGARLDNLIKGQGRRYAAQGTILNGGTLQALDRSAQDYASNEYQNLRNNTFEAYKQKYQQFTDAAGMNLAARTANANENQNTFANNTSSYLSGNARTLSDYLTNVTAKRNSELDYWNRLNDLNSTGANLAGGSYRA